MRVKGKVEWNPSETLQADWLPFKGGEVMYTDGIKTSGFIRGSPHPYSGYVAMNSAGRKGFVHNGFPSYGRYAPELMKRTAHHNLVQPSLSHSWYKR
ncbi:uncharacterized protein LACBIDRAFT_294632 [Laccaria bicolor S238N-H82]|uniref:Predicted protein n=1 Tax=Laccaria bicolor (strain S238N-H82 / ATCC MYA-4686) TaxID=486041 RepID=B0DFL1_LACBS|nr:uncharacterized protein LACBIDRAFT_294632 [Laccaria bicolor S238N-H82]EDR06884.1 predicted protein [Laccaria bicolor S238N-H82]|eukprot:XP_001882731.1 predicted protein [Laccaria bicolor S238N-H82]